MPMRDIGLCVESYVVFFTAFVEMFLKILSAYYFVNCCFIQH